MSSPPTEQSEKVNPCKCGELPAIARTCSGVLLYVACFLCDEEADDIADWNAGKRNNSFEEE